MNAALIRCPKCDGAPSEVQATCPTCHGYGRVQAAATVPLEQYERVVAALDQAVEGLDIATAALQAGGKLPERAILSAKLLHAIRELRGSVAAALGGDDASA